MSGSKVEKAAGRWGNLYDKELSDCESTPCMITVLKSRSARREEYSTQISSVRNADIFMIGYHGRFFFGGQHVSRNIAEQQIIDMRDVL
jgi:hypothetical protein